MWRVTADNGLPRYQGYRWARFGLLGANLVETRAALVAVVGWCSGPEVVFFAAPISCWAEVGRFFGPVEPRMEMMVWAVVSFGSVRSRCDLGRWFFRAERSRLVLLRTLAGRRARGVVSCS